MYKPIDADVVIVGAGVAGLTAAYYLGVREPTLNITVLEGSEQIGGRILSLPLLVEKDKTVSSYDFGAQWISKEQTDLIDLLNTLGVQYANTKKKGQIVCYFKDTRITTKPGDRFKNLNTKEKFQFASFILKVESLSRKIKVADCPTYIKALSNITLEHFINNITNSEAVHSIIEHMVLTHCGFHPNQITALFYMFFCISTRGICQQLPLAEKGLHDLRIKGGAQTICDRLVDDIGKDSINTNEYVKSVSIQHSYAEVVSSRSIYRCYTVIVAVPPANVLNIKFSPPLSDRHLEALRRTCTSTVTTFTMTFEREFWKDRQLSGDCYFFDMNKSKGPVDHCVNISTRTHAALTGKIFSEKATMDGSSIYRNEVLEQLSEVFGEDIRFPIDYKEISWSGHRSQMIGWGMDNDDYVRQVCQTYDRLLWAGAETSVNWYGHLAGAVNSGMRASLEALCIVRPAAITASDLEIIFRSNRRNTGPMRTYYDETLYSVAEHWKLIVSVSVVVLIALWRLRKWYS